MNHPGRPALLVCCLSLLMPRMPLAAENQLIDDYWMRKDSPAPPRSSSAKPAPAAPRAQAAAVPPAQDAATAASQGKLVPAIRGLPPDPGDDGTYRIAPHDLLKIQVFQVDELSSEERVNEEGQIVMALVGPVKVGGMTPKEAGTHIAAILGKDLLQNPQVDVLVKESTRQHVTVMGSVKKPGVFPIAGQVTLLQAIALAEGAAPLAKESEVIVFRPDASGTVQAYVIDLEAIKQGTLRDPILVGDDRVMVPESGTAVFFKGVADTLRGFVSLSRPIY